ncbi:aldose 1-epimerase family protein [Streptococcus suis]|nr:aldose 1-epimerase family protein [Streptococcus suis]
MKYTLSNDNLKISCDTLGGQLISIQNRDGLEYLWQGDAAYWSGQAPVLFPICGSLRDNRAETFEGQTVAMPRHGIVRKCEFNCDYVSERVLVFSIESSRETLQAYPYEFKLSSRYQLQDNQVEVTYTIFNRSDKTMPFFIGGHPGFNCPLEPGLSYEDYAVHFNAPEELTTARPIVASGLLDRENRVTPVGFDGQVLPVTHEHFMEDGIYFDKINSDSVVLKSDKGSASVQVNFAGFPNLVIWSSANEGPFVALEPMVGLSTFLDEDDCFEHKENLQTLAPKEFREYTFRIIIS